MRESIIYGMRQGDKVLGLACLVTLLHYTGAYMRVPAMALYAGFGLGPILGGYVAQGWSERAAFVVAGIIIAAALAAGGMLPRVETGAARSAPLAAFDQVRRNRRGWAGWIATVSGLGLWGAILTFFPLLARERGILPLEIGLVLGVQAFVNTAARVPAGWLLAPTGTRGADRPRGPRPP